MPVCLDDLDCVKQINSEVDSVSERLHDIYLFLTTKSDTTVYILILISIFVVLIFCVVCALLCWFGFSARSRKELIELRSSDEEPLFNHGS